MSFFANLHRNRCNKHISLITKIVLVVLLFCVISDKTGAFRVSQDVTKMQTFNFDFVANELMMFSKFSFNYSFFMTLGFICITAGVMLIITCKTMSFSEEKENKECANDFSYNVESAKDLHTNNIYLLNNQFIC